ncbi:SPOR domain-containing protein [Flavobacterium franklandianum]|uniref:SPOR domain-containing protein n=1 Tax=Flavobacterium franklandianum TaxID=2594430 RepID=A0A553CT81_9FLAO|nr:SPOR domain-containing protein [Flavobacterium franklandianum]TRX23707.1 SPOR domain-containing protein [Flavobacterium franklandianum]TRX26994.1 SPOR domain-containing protein [Flavobacterium franklandianum]
MNIEPYIAQLLYRYQCVTVPGFGAFLTEIQSAQLIESSNSFFPPKKMISFNAHLKNNDGLLANHIAQAEKTSYEYAISAIQYEVFNWKKALLENGLFSIKNVGNFSLNADKNLIFTPYDQTNYLTNSFGLSAFVSPLVKREIFEQKIEALEENEVIEFIPEIRRTSAYLKYVAIFVLGLGITVAVGYPVYQQQIANETIIVEQSVQKQVQNKIQEATFFIENPVPASLPAVTLTVKEQKLSYHIMAGAFREEKNAQKAFQKLSNEGYKARRIPQNKYGLFPVLYGSYATFAEAEKASQEIQKTDNPDAWILIESL